MMYIVGITDRFGSLFLYPPNPAGERKRAREWNYIINAENALQRL